MGNPVTKSAPNRAVFKETDDYRIWYENMEDQLVIHVVIHNATKSVIEEIKEGWAELLIEAYFEGFEFVYTYTKDSRIVNMIGGAILVATHEDYEVWQWDLR